jgi:hypothetical protein
MKYPKRTQYKYAKTPYRVNNWAAYEAGLRQGGSVTIWITEDAKKYWCYRGPRKPGGKRIYSDAAIETFWMISMIYGLALRQTEGFIESLFELTGVALPIPDHSTVSRRVRILGKVPMMSNNSKGSIHLVVDSSGLRIHVGQARKSPKRRAWRKIHLAVDRETGDIMAADLTASNARDAARVPALLSQINSELASLCGDGAYDRESVYEEAAGHSADRRTRVVIPPQKGALQRDNPTMADRNRHIRSIRRIGRRD